jgi:ADP-ribose pyrophosphatase YjhB (NUDIX family)
VKSYKYCPWCKGGLTKNTDYSECTNCHKRIYYNSLISGSAFIIDGDKVLLGKRAIEPFKGKYDIIGGFLKAGELPKAGAIREVKEETGLDIKMVDLLGFFLNKGYEFQGEKYKVIDVFYVAKISGGKPKPSDDVKSLHWIDINNPPPKNEVSHVTIYPGLLALKKWHKDNKVIQPEV